MTNLINAAQAIEWANSDGACWFTSSSGLIELAITLEDARSGSHQGSCDGDVAALLTLPYIAEQIEAINPKLLADELSEWGAWDDEELADHDQNKARILWLACSDICDNN